MGLPFAAAVGEGAGVVWAISAIQKAMRSRCAKTGWS